MDTHVTSALGTAAKVLGWGILAALAIGALLTGIWLLFAIAVVGALGLMYAGSLKATRPEPGP